MQILDYNINHRIKVKLNEKGYQRWLADCNMYGAFLLNRPTTTIHDLKDKADDEGYTTFQMWEFMQIFGESFHMGGDQICDLNVKLIIE